DVPGAELAEDAPAPRLVPRVGGPKNVRADVLQVDVPDAGAPAPKGRARLAAGGCQMSRVEQERNIGALEEALDLGPRLHARAHVVVEDGLEATVAGPFDRLGNAVEVDLAVSRSLVGQHGRCRDLLEQVEGRVERAQVLVAEPKLDEGAGELEAVPLEAPAQRRRVAEIAKGPELGPFVAGGGDCVEHGLGARHVGKETR